MPRTKLELARIENERKRLEKFLHKLGMHESIPVRAIEYLRPGQRGVLNVFRGDLPLIDAEKYIYDFTWEPASFILRGEWGRYEVVLKGCTVWRTAIGPCIHRYSKWSKDLGILSLNGELTELCLQTGPGDHSCEFSWNDLGLSFDETLVAVLYIYAGVYETQTIAAKSTEA